MLPPLAVLVELAGILLVGQAIGAGWTLLLLLVAAVAGALLLVRGGVGGLRRAAQAGRSGRPAGRELVDAGMLGLGALLLLLPGFVSDVLGLLCVLPPTRPAVRRLLGRLLTGAVMRVAGVRPGDVVAGQVVVPPGSSHPSSGPPPGPPSGRSSGQDPRRGGGDDVLRGRVLPPPEDPQP